MSDSAVYRVTEAVLNPFFGTGCLQVYKRRCGVTQSVQFATPGGKLTRQVHKELNKLGRYKPDGISSKEGEDKLYDIQRHYVYEIADKPDARERFNTKFWEDYDKNILPMMLKDAHKERPAKPILEETPEYKALVEKKEKRKLDAKHFAMV